jgi:5-methyltetrahydrofolate--homocysteine methyltransferase
MMEMKGVIKALEERQLRTGCKVVVGGAPVSAQFAQQIGADGYAPNAVEAVHLAKRLLAGAAAHA